MRPPPTPLVLAGGAVVAVTAALAVHGAFHTGITTDEPIHVMRLRNLFDTGWYALDWDYAGAGPGSEGTNTFVYAPVTMLLLHAWSVLWGVEGWGEVAATPHAYDVRHLGVVLLGLTGVAAVAATGRVVLRCWRWGLVAAAALSAVPMWTGHEMFNVKDVPVATGYTLTTLGLLMFVRSQTPGPRLRLLRAGCLAAGLVLALGTRPGMWPGLLASLVVAVVGVGVTGRGRRAAAVSLAEVGASCAVAAGVLVAAYPRLFGSPLRALPRTSESSSSFLAGAKSDRLYVPRHLAEEMPTLLLAFAMTGLVVALLVGWRRRRDDPVGAARLALVGVQATVLPVVAVLLGSDLYHGLRQLLFAIPALAVLAAYGMAWWLQRATGSGRTLWVGAAAAAALVLPTADQVTLQPYQTTYVNVATDLLSGPGEPPEERPGGDFWRVSLPELVTGADLDRQLLCKAATDPETGVALPFANAGEAFSTSRSLDCREEATGPLAPDRLPVVRRLPVREYDAVFINALPPNCRTLRQVTRWRHGFEVVLSTLARCSLEPPALPADGARVADPAFGTTGPGDLWRHAVDGWLQWPGVPELSTPVPLAEVAFAASPTCRHGCILVVVGTGPPDLVATVAGVPVPVTRAPGTVRLSVSAALARSAVWVTLTRRSGGPLGMHMTGLRLEALPDGAPTRGTG